MSFGERSQIFVLVINDFVSRHVGFGLWVLGFRGNYAFTFVTAR